MLNTVSEIRQALKGSPLALSEITESQVLDTDEVVFSIDSSDTGIYEGWRILNDSFEKTGRRPIVLDCFDNPKILPVDFF
ncbi:MAG: hypothetical protein AAGF75_06065, partial [Cyanobacteria bacterium P01_H01_bin.130]